jgi:hypothetical protein
MEYSQTQTNDADPITVPLAQGLVPFGCKPTSATGAPKRKRLKSHREQGRLMNSKKMKSVCGFCLLPNHTVKQCDLLRSFVGNATEILVDNKKDFAWSLLSGTKLYQVEPFNDGKIWQQGGLPVDAHHVVILAMLEGSNQSPNDVVGGTGLLVNILSRTAHPLGGHIGPTVYRSKAVSKWIISKGQAKPKQLFSSLQSCPSDNQMDNMLTADI